MRTSFITRFIPALMVLWLVSQTVWAQNAEFKWGSIPKTDLEMTSYVDDPNAEAVILGEMGSLYPKDDGYMIETHRRIKLLKEGSFDRATIQIRLGRDMNVSDIDARTYNLDASGKVVISELRKEDVFTEKTTKGLTVKKFTLPNLKVGSVIEFRYKRFLPGEIHFNLPSWRFQDTDPVVFSDYRVRIPGFLNYAFYKAGAARPFDVEERSTMKQSYGEDAIVHWRVNNISALRKEPYMPASIEDELFRVEFQLSQVAVPGQPVENILTTWETVNAKILERNAFKNLLKAKKIQETSQTLVASLATPEEKMQAIYAYVQEKLPVNGASDDNWADGDLGRAFDSGKVGRSQQALIMTAMLKHAGLDAEPVLAKDRDNGQVITVYPAVGQFDFLICHVKIGDKQYLLDASDLKRPINLLPEDALNDVGFVISPTRSGWVQLRQGSRLKKTIFANLSFDEENKLVGRVSMQADEYAGFLTREELQDAKDETEYIRKSLFGGDEAVEIEKVEVENLNDINKPLTIHVDFKQPGQVNVTPDLIYVTPVLFQLWKDQPLKSDERHLPLDFVYPIDHQYILRLNVPKGFAVEEQPKAALMRLSESGGEYRRIIQAVDSTITVNNRFTLKKARFAPRFYPEVREMMDRMISGQNDQIVFKRKTEIPVPPAGNQTPAPKPSGNTPKPGQEEP